jgi:hypothetical protein
MQPTPILENRKIGRVGAAGRGSVLRLGKLLSRFDLFPEGFRSP